MRDAWYLAGVLVLAAGPAFAASGPAAPPVSLWDTIGRFHPALVHFPVALLVTAAVSEALCIARRDGRYADAARIMVTAAALVGVLTGISGFARAGSITLPETARDAFAVHRIAAIVTVVLAFLAAGLGAGVRRSGQIWELFLYRIVLILAAAAAVIAGYKGGEIVFGQGFFPLW